LGINQVKHFKFSTKTKIQLSKKSQATNIVGNRCIVRSLEYYSKNLLVPKNTTYQSVLKNYFYDAQTWVLISKTSHHKLKYLTFYCFNVPSTFTIEDLENDLNGAISISKINTHKKYDWIEHFSSFLFWRPSFSKANQDNFLKDDQLVSSISTKRNNRSVIKFKKMVYPFKYNSPHKVGNKCGITSLFKSNQKYNYKNVGEYKIVNLDYVKEQNYLLIVGRNFFKRPMYAMIHCHNINNNFTIKDLTTDLDNIISLHKIKKTHW